MGERLDRRWVAIITAATIMIGCITVVASIYFFVGRNHQMSWGEKISAGEDYLYIDGKTLTNDDLAYIMSLRRLRSLELTNCNVAECRLRDLKFASREIWSVDLSGTKGLWDLSFLATSKIRHLTLNGCPGVDDISDLNWDELSFLELDDTDVTDLSPLAGSEVMELSFARTDVSDLTPLKSLANELWEVDGSYTKVSSIDVLADAGGLTTLCFDGCPIKEVRKPFTSRYLREVSLAHTPVIDLSGLSNCAVIEKLNLGFAQQLTDMSWLNRQCYETLTTLDLGETGFSAQDVSWVSSCRNLEELTLDGIALGDLELCRQLKALEWLSAVDCDLTSISGIAGCKKLVTMLFGYNRIESLDGLSTPTSEWRETVLDLSHNHLSSVADLPRGEYRCIFLQGNEADLGRTVPANVDSYLLVVDWFGGLDDSRLRDSTNVTYIYLLGCPEDQRAAIERNYWSWRVHFVTEEELLELIEQDDLVYGIYDDMSRYVETVRLKSGITGEKGADQEGTGQEETGQEGAGQEGADQEGAGQESADQEESG